MYKKLYTNNVQTKRKVGLISRKAYLRAALKNTQAQKH